MDRVAACELSKERDMKLFFLIVLVSAAFYFAMVAGRLRK